MQTQDAQALHILTRTLWTEDTGTKSTDVHGRDAKSGLRDRLAIEL